MRVAEVAELLTADRKQDGRRNLRVVCWGMSPGLGLYARVAVAGTQATSPSAVALEVKRFCLKCSSTLLQSVLRVNDGPGESYEKRHRN